MKDLTIMQLRLKPRLLCMLVVLAYCLLATGTFTISGLVSVVPESDYVEVGSNYTVYCKINRTMTSRTSQDLTWHKGYPEFSSIGSSPQPLPENVQRIVNDTTKSITLINAQTEHTGYYFCFLEGETEFRNTDNCDVHVIEPPSELSDLSCSSYSLTSFYCWWQKPETNYPDEFNATFQSYHEDQRDGRAREMKDCGIHPTPDVPDDPDRYQKRCVADTSYVKVEVTVVTTNPVGSSTTTKSLHIPSKVTPLPLDDLSVTARGSGFQVTGGPPPFWRGHMGSVANLDYIVEYRQHLSNEWVSIKVEDGEDELDTIVDSLHPNALYHVRAKSVYPDRSESDFSIEKMVKTLGTIPLGGIHGLRVHEQFNQEDRYSRTVRISWEGLEEEEEGSDDFAYFLELINQATSEVVISTSLIAATYVTPKISRFSAYDVHVFPGNNLGNNTNGIATVTIEDDSGTPGRPHDVTLEAVNNSAVVLKWEDPEEPNSIIAGFLVQWEMMESGNERSNYSLEKREGDLHFEYTITGLVTFKPYRFSVCAYNEAGTCSQNVIREGRTEQGVPDSPPQGFSAEGRNLPNSLQLHWTEPQGEHNGIISHYQIHYCIVKEEECINAVTHTASVQDGTRHSYHLEGLEPYTRHRLQICAATVAGCGPYTDPVEEATAQGTPESPRNLRLANLNSTLVRLEWDPPLEMNGRFDEYHVACSECKTTSQRVETTSVALEVYGDTDIVIKVKTCSHASRDPCSQEAQFLIHTPIGKSSPPRSFVTSNLDYNEITLSWSRPEHPNGVIAHYSISQRHSPDEAWQVYDQVSETSIKVQVDCQSGGGDYDFSVAAVTKNGTVRYIGEPVEARAEMCAAIGPRNVLIMFVLVPVVALLVVFCLVTTMRYHLRVKRNLPDPYFIDAVKSSIYGQKSWTSNENQFFIVERESFDPLRCVDDSTQLLGLDRTYLTEGSTSSSDQGIHDMDGHLTSTGSCTRLVPEEKVDMRLGGRRALRVLSEDYDKDDAVFPEDTDNYGPSDSATASLSYAGAAQIGTPPNSPASLTASNRSSDKGDSGNNSTCSETTKYAKLGGANLSPSSTLDHSSRPLSSASEDSMSYTRIGENSFSPPNSATSNPDLNSKPLQDLPKVVFNDQMLPCVNPKDTGADSGMDQVFQSSEDLPSNVQHRPVCQGVRDVPRSPEKVTNRSPAKARLPSLDSSTDDLSGYCKQDVSGITDAVTSSGVSSMAEDYSRIAEGSGEMLSPGSGYPLDPPPPYSVDDPYVTNQEMEAKEDLLQHNSPPPSEEPSPSVETSPYTSPYVTSEHAV